MKSGIIEHGQKLESDRGVEQGGCLSPVMANVYLHYVLDMWFNEKAKKQCQGRASIIRYADDVVFCFSNKGDAEMVQRELKQRLAKFGLAIATEKTRLIPFGRKVEEQAQEFDFLGFTFYMGKNMKGKDTVKLRTSGKKLKQKRQAVKEWLHKHMHVPVAELIKALNKKLVGHYNYYGVTHNTKKMRDFYQYVEWILLKTLQGRSQRDRTNWDKLKKILSKFPIKQPKIKVAIWS